MRNPLEKQTKAASVLTLLVLFVRLNHEIFFSVHIRGWIRSRSAFNKHSIPESLWLVAAGEGGAVALLYVRFPLNEKTTARLSDCLTPQVEINAAPTQSKFKDWISFFVFVLNVFRHLLPASSANVSIDFRLKLRSETARRMFASLLLLLCYNKEVWMSSQ